MLNKKRYKLLVDKIIEYLSEWLDDSDKNIPCDESIKEIESYGVQYSNPNNALVRAAIRHILYYVNPMHKSHIPDLLEEVGFREEEISFYLLTLYASGDSLITEPEKR